MFCANNKFINFNESYQTSLEGRQTDYDVELRRGAFLQLYYTHNYFATDFVSICRYFSMQITESEIVSNNCRSCCEEQGIKYYRFNPTINKANNVSLCCHTIIYSYLIYSYIYYTCIIL